LCACVDARCCCVWRTDQPVLHDPRAPGRRLAAGARRGAAGRFVRAEQPARTHNVVRVTPSARVCVCVRARPPIRRRRAPFACTWQRSTAARGRLARTAWRSARCWRAGCACASGACARACVRACLTLPPAHARRQLFFANSSLCDDLSKKNPRCCDALEAILSKQGAHTSTFSHVLHGVR
jgi:hypothetical protein